VGYRVYIDNEGTMSNAQQLLVQCIMAATNDPRSDIMACAIAYEAAELIARVEPATDDEVRTFMATYKDHLRFPLGTVDDWG